MANYPFGPGASLQQQAATAAAGFALQNATPTILTWTPPNDGNVHYFIVISTLIVATNLTGGNIQMTFNDPAGNARTPQLYAPNATAGMASPTMSSAVHAVAGGTPVTLLQQTAVTGGAATMYAAILGY